MPPAAAGRAANVRFVTWNTHASVALRNGGLRVLRERARPHVVALQEVRDLEQLRDIVDRLRWRAHIIPAHQPSDLSGTVLLADAERFELGQRSNRRINRGISRMHPARRLTTAVLHDRITGRDVIPTSVHTWAMGRGLRLAQPYVRRMHIAQVREVAEAARLAPDDAVVVPLGDWNEPLQARAPKGYEDRTAVALMRAAGFRPAFNIVAGTTVPTSVHGPNVLDSAFIRTSPFLEVRRHRVIPVPVAGGDHHADLTVVHVQPILPKGTR